MVARNRGRYLAPVALLATITIVVVIVRHGLATAHHPVRARPVATRISAATEKHLPTFYVIRAGDSLSTISVKTGISIPALEALNPTIDPYALQTGQRLRLRR
jgi:LysM repeat protein